MDEVRTELVGVGLRRESWVSSAGPAAPPLPASEPGASAAPAPGGRSSRKAQEGEEGRTPRPAQGGLPGSRGVGAVSRRPLRRLRPRREGTGRARDPACPRAKEEPEDGGSRDKKGQGAGDRARQEGGHLAEAQKRDGIGGRAGSEGTPSPTLPASGSAGLLRGPATASAPPPAARRPREPARATLGWAGLRPGRAFRRWTRCLPIQTQLQALLHCLMICSLSPSSPIA